MYTKTLVASGFRLLFYIIDHDRKALLSLPSNSNQSAIVKTHRIFTFHFFGFLFLNIQNI